MHPYRGRRAGGDAEALAAVRGRSCRKVHEVACRAWPQTRRVSGVSWMLCSGSHWVNLSVVGGKALSQVKYAGQ